MNTSYKTLWTLPWSSCYQSKPRNLPTFRNLTQPHATWRHLTQLGATSRHLAQPRQPFAARHHFRPPLNKRILFRIVTTIPQQSRRNLPSLHRTSSPPPHMSLKPGHMAHLNALMPHISLRPRHMVRFNVLYAPHVPQTRTHGAPQRPECPTCPSNPDTWRDTLWHWHLSKFFKDIHNLRVP